MNCVVLYLGNVAIETCSTDQNEGVCVLQDEVTTASVVCCRDVAQHHHYWSNSFVAELEGVSEHGGSDDNDVWNRHPHRMRRSGHYSSGANDESECFPTEVSYIEAEEFCASLEEGTFPSVG